MRNVFAHAINRPTKTKRQKLTTKRQLFKLATDVAHQFCKRYGYHDDKGSISARDMRQIARMAAIEAIESHDPKLGDIGQRVRFCVNRELFEVMRTAARRHRICQQERPNEKNDLTGFGFKPSKFQLVDFLDELSEDAKTIVQIVLTTPGEIFQLTGCARAKAALLSHLESLGWQTEMALVAFSEIKEALV